MSLSDCKNGSNTPRHHNYSLHSLPIAETYGKRPVQTFLDFRDTNVPEKLYVKYVPMLFFTNLQRISKVKVVSFLLGLTLTFLIMASYVLMWDKKGLLFTPSPYQVRPAAIPSSTAAAARASSKKNLINIKALVKIISSKQEYTPRKVPDEKDVVETDSHLFSVIPRHFLPDIKSPCWYEEFSSKPGTDPYGRNLFTLRSKTFKTVCDRLRVNFHQHLYHRDGKDFRLRCLPYFYIIGQPKCGTTDLFHRLLLHPEVKFNIMKEPHWWTRKRFGYIRFKDGFQKSFPVEDYLDLFDLAAHKIQEGISGNSSGDHRVLQLITVSGLDHFQQIALTSEALQCANEELEGNSVGIIQDIFCGPEQTAQCIYKCTQKAKCLWALSQENFFAGEASASTMWDNQAWSYLHADKEETEPPFLAQDFIHAVQPDARIIIMLRDPVERLYSDYLYFKMANKSAEDFHQKVIESVQLFQSCLSERSLRSCAYNTSLSNIMPVRLNLGMYIVFLLDWLTVFSREQILVLRLEDYAANLEETIKKVFDFLSLGPLSEQAEAALTKRPMSNTRRVEDRNLGPMLPATRNLLSKFHQPFNHKLASVLDNKAFLWSNT